MTAVGCRLSAVGCRLSAVGCRLSAIGCRLSAVGCRLSAVRCPLSAIRCPLSAGCIPESRVAPAAPGFYSLSAFRRGEAATVISSGAACWYVTDGKRSHDTLSREISHRNAARTIRGGDFPTLWRLCIESPSQPKLASSLHNKRLSYWRLTGFGRNDGRGAGRLFYNLRRSRHHNPRPERPSNLRTLRPIGPVNPKNFPF